MELRDFNKVRGVFTTEAIVEGRFVLLTPNAETYDFGSRADLPGVKVPTTAAEATRARFCLAFSPDNRKTPIYQPMPSMDWALRAGGWDQSANVPFSATVYLTHPENQEGRTVPSGSLALAFSDCVITLPSGAYVENANIKIKGNLVSIANTAEDGAGEAGKPKYEASYDADQVIGEVYDYDSATGRLTILVN
jgi:hypothetical protein